MAPSVPAGFKKPDMDSPLDIDALAARMTTVRIRGMFMQNLVEECTKRGKPLSMGPYIAFKDYDVKEHLRLLRGAAEVLHPGVPLRRAFRSLGRSAYETMTQTMIGKVVFGVLGRDIVRVTKLVGKAYEIAGTGVSATLIEMGNDWSHVRIDGAIGLVDNYHVGAFEGVLSTCGQTGEVHCKVHDGGGELFTTWRRA
jgi:uncharacterized protein (TIGR02265 family)